MRHRFLFTILLLAVPGAALAQTWQDASLTPAEQKAAWAKTEIARKPNLAQPYNDLAVALMDRARESGDASYYGQAETATQSALALDPSNFEALRAEATLLLARGQYAKAIELARKLNARNPDDILTYGLLADGLMETGDYEGAVDAAQWMMNLRAANVPGLQRAARLRWLHGEIDGSLSLYNQAYEETPPMQAENRAWILTRMAEIQIACGRLNAAQESLQGAFSEFPDYYLAMEASARLAEARGDFPQAVALLRKRNAAFPTLDSRYQFAQALERAGDLAESRIVFSEFEKDALSVTGDDANANRSLVFYELSRGNKPEQALSIAERESKKRHDAYTLDAYAWALYKNGRYSEAEKQMHAALAFGLKDAELLFHAGAIEAKLDDQPSALRDLKSSLELDPSSDVAAEARQLLNQASAVAAASAGGR